jgi:hypothetical protein
MITDALTESFCERCGTRYEFAAPEKLNTTRRARGLISGLKNYILSQDTLSDAVGDAMRSQEEVLAAKQLDAFHQAFNFCIDCRQYTCLNCWNDAEGRCQSCQPLPQFESLAHQFEATVGQVQPEFEMPYELAPAPSALGDEVLWPTSDLTEPEPEPMVAVAEPEPEPEPMVAVAEPEPEPEPMVAAAEPEPEPMVAAAEPEPEPMVAAAEPEPEPEPVLAEVEPEPEPVLAEVEPEPQPEPVRIPEAVPHRPLRPISDTFMHYPRSVPDAGRIAASAADQETLAARRAQLELLGLGDPGQGPVARRGGVVLPYRSSGAAASHAERRAAANAGVAFWDASAREVAGALSRIGVRSCGHCELSLSATARFCRRCGTPQSQSA